MRPVLRPESPAPHGGAAERTAGRRKTPQNAQRGTAKASLLATKDVTVHVLEGYGHLDVIAGSRARDEVLEPCGDGSTSAACAF
jgi:hypothetical protein